MNNKRHSYHSGNSEGFRSPVLGSRTKINRFFLQYHSMRGRNRAHWEGQGFWVVRVYHLPHHDTQLFTLFASLLKIQIPRQNMGPSFYSPFVDCSHSQWPSLGRKGNGNAKGAAWGNILRWQNCSMASVWCWTPTEVYATKSKFYCMQTKKNVKSTGYIVNGHCYKKGMLEWTPGSQKANEHWLQRELLCFTWVYVSLAISTRMWGFD